MNVIPWINLGQNPDQHPKDSENGPPPFGAQIVILVQENSNKGNSTIDIQLLYGLSTRIQRKMSHIRFPTYFDIQFGVWVLGVGVRVGGMGEAIKSAALCLHSC